MKRIAGTRMITHAMTSALSTRPTGGSSSSSTGSATIDLTVAAAAEVEDEEDEEDKEVIRAPNSGGRGHGSGRRYHVIDDSDRDEEGRDGDVVLIEGGAEGEGRQEDSDGDEDLVPLRERVLKRQRVAHSAFS